MFIANEHNKSNVLAFFINKDVEKATNDKQFDGHDQGNQMIEGYRQHYTNSLKLPLASRGQSLL